MNWLGHTSEEVKLTFCVKTLLTYFCDRESTQSLRLPGNSFQYSDKITGFHSGWLLQSLTDIVIPEAHL